MLNLMALGLDLSAYYRRSQVLDLSASVTNQVFRDIVAMIAGRNQR